MKNFKKLSLTTQAILVYLLSITISIIFSPLFDKIYNYIFHPIIFGEGLFLPIPQFISVIITGFFFGIFFFLSFFVFLLIEKKQWIIWGVGSIIPIFMILDGGVKHLFWSSLFCFFGWALAQGVLYLKSKIKFKEKIESKQGIIFYNTLLVIFLWAIYLFVHYKYWYSVVDILSKNYVLLFYFILTPIVLVALIRMLIIKKDMNKILRFFYFYFPLLLFYLFLIFMYYIYYHLFDNFSSL